MKIKSIIGIAVLTVFSLFVIASFAQRSSAQTDTNGSNASSATSGYMGRGGMMYGGGMYGGMMNGRMMYGRSMMGRNMMGNYSAMRNLMNRLASDLSEARAQAGSASLKGKLDDAGSLVSKLRAELSHSWGTMMQYMPMNGNSYCYWNQTGHQQKQ